MHAVHETACRPRRNRLRLTFAVIAASVAVAACGDDASSGAGSQERAQNQARQAQHPTLATTFNAGAAQSSATADATLLPPQSSAVQLRAVSPTDASATDSVVLAPPVIHTVD